MNGSIDRYNNVRKKYKFITFVGILTPSDEFTYWNEAKHTRGNRERAEHLVELFQPISSEFGSIDSMTILDVSLFVCIVKDAIFVKV